MAFGEMGCCCICLESLSIEGLGRQTLSCGHMMHELCVIELRRRGSTGRCPVCRESHMDLTPVQSLLDQAARSDLRRQYDDAFRLYSEALDIDPVNTNAAFELGSYCLSGIAGPRDRKRAMIFFDVARRGGNLNGVDALAQCHLEDGELDKAKDLYVEEMRCGASVYAACRLHTISLQQGDFGKANQFFDIARNLYEESNGCVDERGSACLMGQIYFTHGRIDKAIELLEEQRRQQGDVDVSVHVPLIQAYLAHGNIHNIQKAKRLIAQLRDQSFWSKQIRDLDQEFGCGMLDDFEAECNIALESDAPARTHDSQFKPGDQVRIHSLVSATGQMLNGQMGMIVRFDRRSERYAVRISNGKEKGLQPQNLDLVETVFPTSSRSSAAELEKTESCHMFAIGDLVWIHGLTSDAGLPLNGCSGCIISYAEETGRFGVQMEGTLGPKAIKPENLAHSANFALPTPWQSNTQSNEEFVEDLLTQTVLEESMADGRQSQAVIDVNAHLSEAILGHATAGNDLDGSHNDSEETSTEKVWLLQFRKHPHEFAEALLGPTSPLRPVIDDLSSAGHQCVLPGSGAKVFVRTHQWHQVIAELEPMDLRPYHVAVAESYEHLLHDSLQSIRCRRRPTLKKEDGRIQLLPNPSTQHAPETADGQSNSVAEDDCSQLVQQGSACHPNWDVFEELFAEGFWQVRRSFLCAVPRLLRCSAVTQSTSQHYDDQRTGPRNPRRYGPKKTM